MTTLFDAIRFGDLVRRLRENAPLDSLGPSTPYGGGANGCIDCPTLDEHTTA